MKEKNIETNTIKAGSLPREQNKNISQNSKKFFKRVAAGGFATLTKYYLYNYNNNSIWLRVNIQCWC